MWELKEIYSVERRRGSDGFFLDCRLDSRKDWEDSLLHSDLTECYEDVQSIWELDEEHFSNIFSISAQPYACGLYLQMSETVNATFINHLLTTRRQFSSKHTRNEEQNSMADSCQYSVL